MEKVLTLGGFWSAGFAKNRVKVIGRKDNANQQFILALALIGLNAILLTAYIYSVNKSAGQGYEIKKLQIQLAQLDEDNKKINLKISEASSMVSIQSGFLSSNFVPAGTPKFLQATQLTQR